MRSRVRALAVVMATLLLFTLLPVTTGTNHTVLDTRDFRIVSIRAVTSNATGYAEDPWFPEAGRFITVVVRVQVFQSGNSIDFTGPFRLFLDRIPSTGGGRFQDGGCVAQPNYHIPAAGRDITLFYEIPAGQVNTNIDIRAKINEKCPGFQDSYNEFAEIGDDKTGCTGSEPPVNCNNIRDLRVVTGKHIDLGISDTACLTTQVVGGATVCDQIVGGPGNTANPRPVIESQSPARVENATRMCREDRNAPATPQHWYRECVSAKPFLTVYQATEPGVNRVYFRVNVSNYGPWGQLSGERRIEPPPQTTHEGVPGNASLVPQNAREMTLLYPKADGAPDQDLVIPVRFEVVKVLQREDGTEYTEHVKDLSPSDYRANRLTVAGCPTTDCIKYLSKHYLASQGGGRIVSHTPVWTMPFDLHGLGGLYEFRTVLNKDCGDRTIINNPPVPDRDCRNNVGTFRFQVRAPDLVASVNPAEILESPYKYGDELTFTGFVENKGDLTANRAVGTATNRSLVRIEIDGRVFEVEHTGPVRWITDDPTLPSQGQWISDSGQLRMYLRAEQRAYFRFKHTLGDSFTDFPPGTRLIAAKADANNMIPESDETNNIATATFRIQDAVKPTVSAPMIFNQRGDLVTGTPPRLAAAERMNISAVVTDSDHFTRDVRLVLTRPDGTVSDCGGNCTLTQTGRTGDAMWFTKPFPSGLGTNGEWKVKVTARDPSGNVAESIERVFRVVSWPKTGEFRYLAVPGGGNEYPAYVPDDSIPNQVEPFHFGERGMPANGSIVPYRETPSWRIPVMWRVPLDPRNETGHDPAWTSKGMTVTWRTPGNNVTKVAIENDRTVAVTQPNGTVNRYTSPQGVLPKYNFTEADFADCTQKNATNPNRCIRYADDTLFSSPLLFGPREIGRYEVVLNLTDVSGESREYMTWFRLRDELPHGNITQVRAATGGNVDDTRWLRANQSKVFRVTAKDDMGIATGGAYLNFTHTATGKQVNLSMTRVGECTRPAHEHCLFERAVKADSTARGGHLPLAGQWNLTVVFVDKNGNWNSTTNRTNAAGQIVPGRASTVVNDTRAPVLLSFGTNRPEEEKNANVTFYARVDDDLDADVLLTVRDSTRLHADRVPMKGPDAFGNFTHVMAFADAATLEFQVVVRDSNTTRTPIVSEWKTLSIRDNLPPRVDALLAHIPGEGHFARAAPVLAFKVFDTAQGVDPASIRMRIDAGGGWQNITSFERTSVDQGKGYEIRYTRDPSQPFVHGQRVNVSIEARDLSDPPLVLDPPYNLTFTVDAIPPKSRIVAFDPKHVARDGDLWNVSLQTRFTAASDDSEDGLPTTVQETRYQFLRNGPSRFFTYNNTPFPMGDLPASMNVGNGEYFVRVVGVDIVGNTETGSSANTLQVFLDQVPPELVRSQLRQTGRLVNATFDDQGAGTKSARIHYRYDTGPYAFLDMVRQPGGTWTATVPMNPNARTVSYFLEATDHVGNRKQFGDELSPPWSFPIGNRPPVVDIVAPESGQRVSGSVTLRWEASDPDGDALTFKVYYKAATGRDELELVTLQEGTTSYVMNTAQLGPDGLYDFRVTASDGHFFDEAVVRLEVQNAGGVVSGAAPGKPQVTPGEPFCYTARVTKQGVSVVEARVYLGEELVQTVAMFDNGRACDVTANDGVYAAELTLGRSGEYDIEVYVRYVEGGEVKEASFRQPRNVVVLLRGIDVVTGNLGLVGAVAALAVAVFGLGGFATFRRWRK